ncbi:MAG: carbohydrate binding domain-containing protein [Firmicutes bacterium]|nr:carbohydrate binding domain-containing protein [Bacillota bacterium]
MTVSSVTAQKWRYVTVKSPVTPEGQMLVNPDFALGTAGWDDPSVVYIADGAAMTLSTEDGALKAEVVAGANAYTPRFGQMNVPFEQDTTYEITFRAKSSVTKIINLQVGELLSAAPYFVDFKVGQTEHRTITTEWATYSYKFTHTLDNKRGGLLFELGTVESQKIDATMWFDDVTVEESTPDADTTAPTFTGVVATLTLTVGASYDPMTGVTAYDVVDGDVTSSIAIEIKDSTNAVVAAVDTSVPGTFTVTYTVSDAASNVATATTAITISSMLFKSTNLVADPSFTSELNTEKPEWSHWNQDGYWGQPAPIVSYTLDTLAGTYAVDIVGGGDAAWSVQVFQVGYITLVQGTTYRLQIDAHASVTRSINVTLGYTDGSYIDYARKNGVEFGPESGTQEFVFTSTLPTHLVQLGFEMGAQPGFADGVFTFEEVRLNEQDVSPIIANGQFNRAGWRGFFNDWEGSTGTYGIEDGEFKIHVTNYVFTGNEWALQLIQDGVSMGGTSEAGVIALEANKTYTLGFDVYASEAMNIHPYVLSSNDWVNLVAEGQRTVAITTVKTHYEVSLTSGATVYGNEILKFQFGDQASFSTEKVLSFDNISVLDGAAPISSVYNGDMETVLGGHSFYTEAPENTFKMTSDGAVATIVTLGGAAYVPHYYYMIDSLAVGNYTVALTMKSSVARDFRLNLVIPAWGYASILPDTKYDFNLLSDTLTQVTVNFVVSTPLTGIKVELDFGTLGGELVSLPTVVTLTDFIIYRNYNAIA